MTKKKKSSTFLSESRAGLTVISDPTTLASHRIRFIVAEKNIEGEMLTLATDAPPPEDFLQANPTGSIPTIIDRDMVLYDVRVIAEYLDERYPHPALMPIDPITRAKIRAFTLRVEKHWHDVIVDLESDALSAAKRKKAVKALGDSIASMAPLFEDTEFLLNDSISLLDCAVVPVLWRLQHFGVNLPTEAKDIISPYAARMFKREAFINSLSAYEKTLRDNG